MKKNFEKRKVNFIDQKSIFLETNENGWNIEEEIIPRVEII